MTETSTSPRNNRRYEAVIIGAGFSGIGMAVQLQQKLKKSNFAIIEKSTAVAGTWYENRYPGAECDVESHLYSFSFYTKYNWPRIYSSSKDIQKYMEECVTHFDLWHKIQFQTTALAMRWIENQNEWEVELQDNITNEKFRYYAKYVMTSYSPLHYPQLPAQLKENFKGQIVHTSNYTAPTSRKVAMIGNAASGIQAIPELAKDDSIDELVVFQRTANWIMPKFNRDYLWLEKLILFIPIIRMLYRQSIYWYRELTFNFFKKDSPVAFIGEYAHKLSLYLTVKDPKVRAALTPKYPLGCKRILLTDNYFSAYNNPKVKLVTDNIKAYHSDCIETVTGDKYYVGSVIAATGFNILGTFTRMTVEGRDGMLLSKRWEDYPESLYGVHIDKFPNFFMMLGPNTGSAHISVVLYVEAQINHIIDVIAKMDAKNLQVIEAKKERIESFVGWLRATFPNYVWDQCTSWYLSATAKGENATLYPGTVSHYISQMQRLINDDTAFTFH